jgi:uncharacterized protein YndB with AHSA1/START domain
MPSSEQPITLNYTIHAPAKEVFLAWVTPRLLQRWGPERAVVDPRLGGQFRFETSAGDETNAKHIVTGEYREFEPAQKLVTTWVYEGPMHPGERVETLLTVEFKEIAPKAVELTLTEEGPSLGDEEDRASALESWREALKMLEIICSAKG